MSWSHSLSTRLNKLPLVLAGPILRRTEKTSVSVWLALKEDAGPMTLNIYYGSSIVMSSQPTSAVKLGDMLFVVLLTATSTTELGSGYTYEYDISFGGKDGNWVNNTLASVGVLKSKDDASGGMRLITYTASGINRPSFSLPPYDVNDLRIIHASCRKPHGGETDALRALDDMILMSIDQPNHRPHQLYLTGDQIYADDVAEILLYMIGDAANSIVGWNEELPNIPTDYLKDSHNLIPGFRGKVVRDIGNLSVDEADSQSHLIKLSEFYLMYLMVWSPVLWVSQDLSPNADTLFPAWEDVYPSPTFNNSTTILNSFISLDPIKKLNINIHPLKKLLDNFTNNKAKIIKFWESLHKVRRALANVPSYMMWDDHEITDDWFIDRKWCQDVLSNTNNLGRRILSNGMSAYMVFQGWGNDPSHPQYQLNPSGTPNTILKELNNLATQQSTSLSSIFTSIETKILPNLWSSQVNNFGEEGSELSDSPDFSYSINFEYFLLLALDTRTKRFFSHTQQHGQEHIAPALLSEAAMYQQIESKLINNQPPSGLLFTLVLAPAPVIGHTIWEKVLQPTITMDTFLGIPLNFYPFNTPRGADIEAWFHYRPCFEKLLEIFSYFENVLILSGDIHFGFSAEVSYWNDRDPNQFNRAAFVQLTSSALKNSTGETKSISGAVPSIILFTEYTVGWLEEYMPTSNQGKYKIGNIERKDDLSANWYPARFHYNPPYVFDFKENSPYVRIKSGQEPQWRYRISFKRDLRPESIRGVFSAADQDNPYVPPNSYYSNISFIQYREFLDHFRTGIGVDNISEVTFNGNVNMQTNQFLLSVNQAFWYSIMNNPNLDFAFSPFTLHSNLKLYFDNNEPLPSP